MANEEDDDDPMGENPMVAGQRRIIKRRRLSCIKNSRKRTRKSASQMRRSFDDIDHLLSLDFTSLQAISSGMDPLTSLDGTAWSLDFLYSWNKYQPCIIDKPRRQVIGDCWSYAFSRGQASLVKRLNSPRKILTQKALFHGVSEKYISEDGGLFDADGVVSFLKEQDYVEDMIIHKRKEGVDPQPYFENLIKRLLVISPLVISLELPPSFSSSFSGSKGIYSPLEIEIEASRFESFSQHCMLLTGHGVVIYDGMNFVKFLEFQDSQGKDWGDNGFLKVANIYAFIREVIEFKV